MIPEKDDDTISFGVNDSHNLKFKVQVSNALKGEVTPYGMLPYSINFEKEHIKHTLKNILEANFCLGITDTALQYLAQLPSGQGKYHRLVTNRYTSSGLVAESVIRSTKCKTVILNGTQCERCKITQHTLMLRHKGKQIAAKTPLTKRTPLSKVSHQKLVSAVKRLRQEEANLAKKVKLLQSQAIDHITVKESLHKQLKECIDTSTIDDPLAKLFWEQQKKAFSTKNSGMRWHPMMIRLAIMLRSQSPAAYDSIRGMGILKLPGESTLRDYTNSIHPQEGFNLEILDEVKKATHDLKDHQRYVVLLHDEMTIQSDLVYDRRSGEVVGFINKNRWDMGADNLATHVLVFMVVGVNTHLKMSLGFFGTRTATAGDLVPLMWEAIGYLETYCNLKVYTYM